MKWRYCASFISTDSESMFFLSRFPALPCRQGQAEIRARLELWTFSGSDIKTWYFISLCLRLLWWDTKGKHVVFYCSRACPLPMTTTPHIQSGINKTKRKIKFLEEKLLTVLPKLCASPDPLYALRHPSLLTSWRSVSIAYSEGRFMSRKFGVAYQKDESHLFSCYQSATRMRYHQLKYSAEATPHIFSPSFFLFPLWDQLPI